METFQTQDIVAESAGTTLTGYFAAPTAPAPGVLVLHAWWGLTPFFKQLCERLAAEGFMAFAPDLNNGKIAHTVEEAEKLMEARDFEKTKAAATAAVNWLLAQPGLTNPGRLGLVGFSMGASWALLLSTAVPEAVGAVVLFYGVEGVDFTAARARFQGHFAETDPWTEAKWVQEMQADMRAANLDVEFFHYPGTGHWFMERDRPDAYSKESADLAWERTVNFLRSTIAGEGH